MSIFEHSKYFIIVGLILIFCLEPLLSALESSNLPIIVIDTHGQNISDYQRVVADMGIIYNGIGKRNFLSDTYNAYAGQIAIELRGSSSMNYPKKQYRFETIDSTGENRNVALLGFPAENDWILNGPYDDRTMIRNVLVYGISNDIGRYASRTQYCELVLNDDYQGLYILMEKVKRDHDRVNISRLNPDEISGLNLTGGYIIKLDKFDGENIGYWNSAQGVTYQYHYPKPDEIVAEQKQYIQDFMNDFETLISGNKWNDPQDGYVTMIDVPSFIDFFIISEFSRNIDAYRLSTYLYKDRDDIDPLLHAGPVWDFNLSFGKAWYEQDRDIYVGWEINHNKRLTFDTPKIPFWWEKLAREPNFAHQAAQRWFELRATILNKDSLYQRIDKLTSEIAEARERNSQHWPEMGDSDDYLQEINYLKNWINNRIDWIDTNINYLSQIDPDDFESVITHYQLLWNYPNPFNESTWIGFYLPYSTPVNLELYDLQGYKIKTLLKTSKEPGTYLIDFNAAELPSGIYLYSLNTDRYYVVEKMTILK
jgi:hypothetical protein